MSSSPYKILSKSTKQFKSCTHQRSLNVCSFGIVGATGLISMESRSPSYVIYSMQNLIQVHKSVQN